MTNQESGGEVPCPVGVQHERAGAEGGLQHCERGATESRGDLRPHLIGDPLQDRVSEGTPPEGRRPLDAARVTVGAVELETVQRLVHDRLGVRRDGSAGEAEGDGRERDILHTKWLDRN